ncbi:ABC transporter permease [Pseudomonas sp. FW300-N2F2]|uniref:ABC transporter permease n=1 Tax=Pseudomonas sp. FW300-N2F2 TaxID=2751320 RepID=UPI001A9175BE|nr:ABC transporter permease [Pseudomonas sp. FW300-N2F2]
MSRVHVPVWRPYVLGALLPLIGLLLWQAAATWGYTGPLFVTPQSVLSAAVEMSDDGQLWTTLFTSLGRYVSGLMLGASAGLATGLLLGLSRLSRLLFGPTLRTVQQISLFAWIPLIMAWFGLAETSKIVFIALAAFFPVLINTFEGVGSVPTALVEVARVHRFSRWQLLTRVVLPSAVPSIFTGFYLALIYAWLATLGAEYMLTSGDGLGNLLIDGQERYRMDHVLLGIFLVAAIGFGLNWLTHLLETRLLRWRKPA